MEYINAIIGETEMFVPTNDRLGELLFTANRRVNYHKYIAVYVDEKGVEKYPWLSMQVVKLPAWLFVAAETSMILLCAVAILMGYRSDKRHLSRMSVKESFDNLPSGICFYEESGLLRLANVKIILSRRKILNFYKTTRSMWTKPTALRPTASESLTRSASTTAR